MHCDAPYIKNFPFLIYYYWYIKLIFPQHFYLKLILGKFYCILEVKFIFVLELSYLFAYFRLTVGFVTEFI